MRNWIYTIFAVILIAVGIVIFVLPIPLGAIMIAAGLGMLMTYSEGFARYVKRLRMKNPKFSGFLAQVEDNMPQRIRGTLERSNPDKFPEPHLLDEPQTITLPAPTPDVEAQIGTMTRWWRNFVEWIKYLWYGLLSLFVWRRKPIAETPPTSEEDAPQSEEATRSEPHVNLTKTADEAMDVPPASTEPAADPFPTAPPTNGQHKSVTDNKSEVTV